MFHSAPAGTMCDSLAEKSVEVSYHIAAILTADLITVIPHQEHE